MSTLKNILGSAGSATNKPVSKWGKLFDGWQAGLVVILFALVAVIISVPHPTLPDEIPHPVVAYRLLAQIRATDDSLAAKAAVQPLDYDVRALGEAIRVFGIADADHDDSALAQAATQVLNRSDSALPKGDDALLQLRAYQMQAFLNELRAFENSGQESAAFRELAGGLIPTIKGAGWIKQEGSSRRFLADDTVRRVLFKRRWNEVTGLRRSPFLVSVDEERALFSFFLDNPIARLSPASPNDLSYQCRSADEYRLKKVGELASVDPKYPVDYARGLLLLRLDRAKDAVAPLSAFVEAHADGPYAIRARNALRFAHERLLSAKLQ